jgi:hypothetical protein
MKIDYVHAIPFAAIPCVLVCAGEMETEILRQVCGDGVDQSAIGDSLGKFGVTGRGG